MSKIIHNWRAARSGSSITINGQLADGSAVRISGIRSIRAGNKGDVHPIAIDAGGTEYRLA